MKLEFIEDVRLVSYKHKTLTVLCGDTTFKMPSWIPPFFLGDGTHPVHSRKLHPIAGALDLFLEEGEEQSITYQMFEHSGTYHLKQLNGKDKNRISLIHKVVGSEQEEEDRRLDDFLNMPTIWGSAYFSILGHKTVNCKWHRSSTKIWVHDLVAGHLGKEKREGQDAFCWANINGGYAFIPHNILKNGS